ncbi:MAG TPA: hypothetical protein VGV17_12515 [Bosea sp. (in: a-proteobacteria)]|uniref:hypothetical protein n=1 Tax=Bosea sp. (in: a-proteobacteria) TaxID=1871050 RepID=UPI002DDD5DFB|nr:hypothetical protein [Bosea sp. (in: a-proteobacteria)]HEV2554573.1 hypothetical protein [Bosea sp. (in: a-proteobacteria)]
MPPTPHRSIGHGVAPICRNDLPADDRADTKGWPVTGSGYVEAESANDKAVLESPWVAAVAEGEGVPSASSPGAISRRPRPERGPLIRDAIAIEAERDRLFHDNARRISTGSEEHQHRSRYFDKTGNID